MPHTPCDPLPHTGRRCCALLLVLCAAVLEPPCARADILVTANAPGVQQSQVAGVLTMNFNAPTYAAGQYTTLSSPIGTYTASAPGFAIVDPKTSNNSDYGGASSTGLPTNANKETQYMAIGAESGQTSVTLSLGQDRNYFGMYWEAGDSKNYVDFYEKGTLVGSMNVASVTSFITSNPSQNSAYYGNPNGGADSGEPFVYLNFYGQNGTSFDRIVFRNTDASSGYESDNHSVATLSSGFTPSGTMVTTLVSGPEPSSWAAGLAVAAVAGVAAWRRRRAESAAGTVQPTLDLPHEYEADAGGPGR